MEGLIEPHLTVFDAVAGAGKTTRAFECAISLAQKGHAVLYTAYNVSVRTEAQHRAHRLGWSHLIVSQTVHSLALEAEKARLRTENQDAQLLKRTAKGTQRSPYSNWYPRYVSKQISQSVKKALSERDALYNFMEDIFPEFADCTYDDLEKDIEAYQQDVFKLVASHSVSASSWPDVTESRTAAFARIFWWLLQRGLVMPTFNSLLKVAVDFPSSLLDLTQRYACVILDEAHDMNDAGVAMFYRLLQNKRGVIAYDQYQEIYPFEFGTSHHYLDPPPGGISDRVTLQRTHRFGNPLAARVQEMVRAHLENPLFSLLPHEIGSTSIIAVGEDLNCLPCYPMMVLGRTHAALYLGLYRMLRHASAPKSITWLGESRKYKQMLQILERYAEHDEEERQAKGQLLAQNLRQNWEDDESYSLWHCIPHFGNSREERRANVHFLIQGLEERKSGQGCDVRASTVHQGKGSEDDRVLALDGFLREDIDRSRCDEYKVCYVAATRARKELLVQCPNLLDALGGPTPEAAGSISWLSKISQRPGRAGDPRGKRRVKRRRIELTLSGG